MKMVRFYRGRRKTERAAKMESSAAMVRNGYPPKFMELKWVKTKPQIKTRNPKEINLKPSSISTIPIYISTDPSHINPRHLSELYKICNHSCHRFPKLDPTDGRIQETVDFDKLCVALSNSCVVVSVFSRISRSDDDESSSSEEKISVPMLGNWMDRMNPVSPSNGQLVGFGRAVSDGGLTASIYDVMVIPSLRRMGIGRMIVKRIVRILTSRDIYDIAALCTEDERLFFRACGFGDDILASTTMMYTKTVDPCFKGDQTVKVAGRKLLLVPQSREENSLQL